MAGAAYGIYQGTVLNVSDPMGAGRIQVMVPSVGGQTSGWAKPCVAPGGSTSGTQIGDQAWVMFEQGDTSSPVFLGVNAS